MRPLLPPSSELLVEAADPAAELPAALSASPGRLAPLLAAAEQHGVLPIVLRKLRERGPARADTASGPAWSERVLLQAGQSMLLRRQAAKLSEALAARGVAARIVKGPVFADKLYRHPADRPFTDVDILVRKDHLAAANGVLAQAGFDLPAGTEASARLVEYKWFCSENSSVLVELHGDLVHLPNLRRRLSLDFDRLARIDGGEADSPPALLAIAVIHAAGGHKFHRLQLLVDVLQAVRALRSTEDETRAIEAAREAGAALEFATVLDVTGRLFGVERALDMAARAASGPAVRLARRLVTPAAILEVGAARPWRSRLRRDAFRWVQRLASAT